MTKYSKSLPITNEQAQDLEVLSQLFKLSLELAFKKTLDELIKHLSADAPVKFFDPWDEIKRKLTG